MLATSQQQGYADTAVDLFLNLNEQFNNQPFVQDLVARFLSKVASSGTPWTYGLVSPNKERNLKC